MHYYAMGITETLAFRYCYHVSDRSVQCVIVTKNSETAACVNTYYEIKQQMDSIPVVVTGNQLRHRLNVLYSFTPVRTPCFPNRIPGMYQEGCTL